MFSLPPLVRPSQNEPAEIGILGKIADALADIGTIDTNDFTRTIGRGELDIVKHPLENRLQRTCADILDACIHIHCHFGDGFDRIIGEIECHAFRAHLRDGLLDETGFRIRQNPFEIIDIKR